MMQFEFPYENIWGIVFLFLLAVILAIQVYFVTTSKRLPPSRKVLRMLLNVFFLISIGLLVLRPFSEKEMVSKRVLIHDGTYSPQEARHWQDSLDLEESIPVSQYQGKGDEVHLLGSNFQPGDMAKLQPRKVSWAGDFPQNEITDLQWQGIIRQGEIQIVFGSIQTEEEGMVSLHLGAEKLDSTQVGKDKEHFRLSSRAKAVGRNELSLRLNDEEIGRIRFFTLQNAPIHYNMLFTYPDMEVRRLAEWLGRQGQHLSSSIQTSAEASQRVITDGDTVQFYITDPSLINSPAIKQARELGASILFTNLDNPETQIPAINRALGTRFQANRVSREGNRQVDANLTALPYNFLSRSNQWELHDGAVAYQQLGDMKVGVSLLEATFPIAFQGDTIRYGQVWEEIFAAMRPVEGIQVEFPQPVFIQQASSFSINSKSNPSETTISEDTVYLAKSAVNPNVATGRWIPSEEGWVSFADTLEVYVHGEELSHVSQNRHLSQFIRHHHSLEPSETPLTEKKELSSWWLFALVLVSSTMMWVEPRVRGK